MEQRHRERGNGLNEGLVVVALISMLMLIVLTMTRKGLEAADTAKWQNQIHQSRIEGARRHLERRGM